MFEPTPYSIVARFLVRLSCTRSPDVVWRGMAAGIRRACGVDIGLEVIRHVNRAHTAWECGTSFGNQGADRSGGC